MTREQLLKIEGITEVMLKPILDINGADIEKEKSKPNSFQLDLEKANEKLTAYETQLEKFKGVDVDKLQGKIKELEGTIQTINQKQEQEKTEAETLGIINGFYATLQDKEFVNSFTQDSITQKIKSGMADPANKGKGISELFDSLTKDVEGIFKNPHPPADIPGAGNVKTPITKDQFTKMGYSDRVKLKTEQPQIYETLKGE